LRCSFSSLLHIQPFINPIANPAALSVNGKPKLVIGRRVELLLPFPAVVINPVRDYTVLNPAVPKKEGSITILLVCIAFSGRSFKPDFDINHFATLLTLIRLQLPSFNLLHPCCQSHKLI
jgi:hypothetical protein